MIFLSTCLGMSSHKEDVVERKVKRCPSHSQGGGLISYELQALEEASICSSNDPYPLFQRSVTASQKVP